jgi:hypothetical protein
MKGSKDKQIQEIKDILEKEHGREFTWQEASAAIHTLERLAEIALDTVEKENKHKEKLKEYPKGYQLEDGGTCEICRTHVQKEKTWYDINGLKCIDCQKAINDKIIPASISKDKESWYSKTELHSFFNIKGSDLNKYIKAAILKDRVVMGEGKKIHLQVFLLKDNKGVLPPKKLLKSRIVKVMRNNEEYYTHEQWYEFVDEKLIKRLMKYKIIDCLKETLTKPIETGRFYIKQINPLFDIKNS